MSQTIEIACDTDGCGMTISKSWSTALPKEELAARKNEVEKIAFDAGWMKDGYHTFTCPACKAKGFLNSYDGHKVKYPLVFPKGGGQPERYEEPTPAPVSRPQGPMEF